MTKFHDARIETRVVSEIKEQISGIAEEKHVTTSELNRLMIIHFVTGKIEQKPV